jgi:hypothetical protein
MSDQEKLAHCVGCRNDFYNDKNQHGVKRCWSLDNANVVTRYRIGWWTAPTSKDAFTKVQTLDCHTAPGQYADYKELPEGLT